MEIDPGQLATRISSESGLEFVGTRSRSDDGGQKYLLQPAHHPPAHAFELVVHVGWRSVDIIFKPGNFASDLLEAMGNAEEAGRTGFVSVLRTCAEDGADVGFFLNGAAFSFDDPSIWAPHWHRVSLTMRKGMLPLGFGKGEDDVELVGKWVSRMSAAVLALLPLESDESLDLRNPEESVVGLPEGSKLRVEVNRYERDRRNRAAALAIHGHGCMACGLSMGDRYGAAAAGLIEVHHTTPVSQLGSDYIIDPRTDLIPLCPNCHSVAHRRSPPFTVEELRLLVGYEVPPNASGRVGQG